MRLMPSQAPGCEVLDDGVVVAEAAMMTSFHTTNRSHHHHATDRYVVAVAGNDHVVAVSTVQH